MVEIVIGWEWNSHIWLPVSASSLSYYMYTMGDNSRSSAESLAVQFQWSMQWSVGLKLMSKKQCNIAMHVR